MSLIAGFFLGMASFETLACLGAQDFPIFFLGHCVLDIFGVGGFPRNIFQGVSPFQAVDDLGSNAHLILA